MVQSVLLLFRACREVGEMGVGGGALGDWASCGLEGDEAVLVGEEDEEAASSQSSGVGDVGGLDLLGLLEGEIESFLMEVLRPAFQN